MDTDLVVFDDDLMRRCSPQFISELAARINDPKDVLQTHGISPQELSFLREVPAFRTAYREAKAFWNSDANYKERIAVKAGTLVEDTLLDVYEIVKDVDSNLAARLDAFKTLSKMAGASGDQKEATGTGQRVSITFNLGGEETRREVQVPKGATIDHHEEAQL